MTRYIRNRFLLLLTIFMSSVCCINAQVTVDAKISNTQILIGEPTEITVEVSTGRKSKVEIPVYDSLAMIVPGVEVQRTSDIDTDLINNGERMVLRRSYSVTSFDSALYYIPPVEVIVDNKHYTSGKNLALKVLTVDIDTTKVNEIAPNKDMMTLPYEKDEWSVPYILVFVIMFAALVILYIIIRLKDNKPIIRRIKVKPRLAPHKQAMQEIEKIKSARDWREIENWDEQHRQAATKEYYTWLTDTLRNYIKERYNFNAMEMTSDEIIYHLKAVNDEQMIKDVQSILATADLVKFAKYSTVVNENDRNLLYAIEYINQTKQEEVENNKPEEVIIVEKGSPENRTIMYITVGVLSVATLCALGYTIYRLYLLWL